MSGWSEWLGRCKAWLDDLKIGTFPIDKTIGSKENAANGVISKINDRMRDALVTL